ncbi:hypothetical protein P4S55_08480 [Shewanella sp. PP-Sp27a-2]
MATPNESSAAAYGDGIACYDSGITNIREIARSLTDVLIPTSILGLL